MYTLRMVGACCLMGLLGLLCAEAQTVQTGFLKVDHTIYDAPHGTAVQKLTRGTHVEARSAPGSSNWFLILVQTQEGRLNEAGYTLNPWLDDEATVEAATRSVARGAGLDGPPAAGAAALPPVASASTTEAELAYVHLFTNVRAAATVQAQAVAQLPPGSAVEVLRTEGNWALVRLPGTGSAEPLGYVSARLLSPDAATTQQTTLVYVTRTGTKFHREGCRHLRSSQFALSLGEATEQGFEACKVCKPGGE